MKILSHFITMVIFATLFTACHKDTDIGDNFVILEEISPIVYQQVTSTIVGTVVDEQGQPIIDAIVQIYGSETKTDKNGVFILKNRKMDQQGTYIRVQKNGYFVSSDFVYPSTGNVAMSRVIMISLDGNYKVDATNGGTVVLTEGGKIIFAPASIKKLNGEPFVGSAIVHARYLAPNRTDLGDIMPGGLIADTDDGNGKRETVVLGTLGMIGVELRDSEGNELIIDPNKPATLEFPVPSNAGSRQSIELWSFNEIDGRWKQEGKAMREGNVFKASVKHFSFWNCDAPFPLIELCGKVIDEKGNPIPNVQIKIEVEGLSTAYGYTSLNGEYIGKVPKDAILKISYQYPQCTEFYKEITVGPFTTNTKLDPITIKGFETLVAKGQLVCQGSPVTDGYIVVQVANGVFFPILVKSDGTWSYDYTFLDCSQTNPISIFGFDNVSGKSSTSVVLDKTNDDNIVLDVCNSPCTFDGVLSFNCDSAIMTITGGSGNFKYEWNFLNAPNKAAIKLNNQDSLNGNILCVNVTDLGASSCTKQFCKPFKGILSTYFEGGCGPGPTYMLTAYPWNGQEQQTFTYLWSNGSTNKSLSNLSPGNYCCTVTDSQGCTNVNCVEVGSNPVITGVSNCDNDKVTLSTSSFDNLYLYGYQGTVNFIEKNFTVAPVEFSVYEMGFNISGTILKGNCSSFKQIALPSIKSDVLKVDTPIQPTCATCNDGKITYLFNPANGCSNCTVGTLKLYKDNNLSLDILSNNGNLGKGVYYLSVHDAITNCVIGFHKFELL